VAKHTAPASKSTATKAKTVASSPAPEQPRPAAVAPPPAHEPSRPATGATASAASAVEACKDRVFLARELCLADVCEKPGARNHPLCVKWREDKRLRENSRIGN
jgi:serine/threonine-protein kinase